MRPSPVHGRGLFALAPIRAGEAVIIWGGVVFTRAEVEAGKVAPGSAGRIGEGVYLGSWAGTYDRERDDRGDFINHSCDPNVWMQDEVTQVARREISAGEELSMDYSMIQEEEDWVAPWVCQCGSALCRGRVRGTDWQREDLQRRYAGHFSPFINRRIEAQHLGVRIRQAQQVEAGAVAELHIRAWQWAYRGQLPDAFLDGLSGALEQRTQQWGTRIGRAEQRVWVAERATRMVGFASTTPSDDKDALPNTGEVSGLYLEADWAGKGVGRLLFAQAVDDLRLRGCDRVTLWVLETNERARRFYEIAGLRTDGVTKVEPRTGFELREVRYRLEC